MPLNLIVDKVKCDCCQSGPRDSIFIFSASAKNNTCSSHHIDNAPSALGGTNCVLFKFRSMYATQVNILWDFGMLHFLLCSSLLKLLMNGV